MMKAILFIGIAMAVLSTIFAALSTFMSPSMIMNHETKKFLKVFAINWVGCYSFMAGMMAMGIRKNQFFSNLEYGWLFPSMGLLLILLSLLFGFISLRMEHPILFK